MNFFNKFYGFIYSRRTFYRAFGQWFALMFPHIEYGGEKFDDVDVEDLRPSYATMQWDKCVRNLKNRLR